MLIDQDWQLYKDGQQIPIPLWFLLDDVENPNTKQRI
jgi:hypothetical protein